MPSRDLTMPRLGLTMDEGVIAEWHKNPGERFQEGEPLFAVETDKATLDVEAETNGVLVEVLVAVGEKANVGVPIARVETAGETAPPKAAGTIPEPRVARVERAASASGTKPVGEGRKRSSPAARRRGRELGIDLGALKGSGPDGRIILRDLPAGTASPEALRGRSIALSPMRRAIAASMTEAAAIPQFRVVRTVDVTRTLALRDDLQRTLDCDRIKLSISDFLIHACALALRTHPEVNASFVRKPGSADEIRLHDQVNIAIALALKEGLVAPVLRDADRITLQDTAKRRRELRDAARSGRLNAQQMMEATFTLSNLGPLGVDQFDAIVTPPQAAVLAAGRVMQRPIAGGAGGVEMRPAIVLTLTADHRAIDGAQAATFLSAIAAMLESASAYRL
ncbi:MAG TPA: dihydrolipoamide acetyltransferase family protein [Burkholderiales bacterium]|nr:dihydrolipoamide acetyltransferase family protein [Burkholderiales bacterium]